MWLCGYEGKEGREWVLGDGEEGDEGRIRESMHANEVRAKREG